MSTRITEITAAGTRYRLNREVKALIKEGGKLHPITPQNMQLLEFFVSRPERALVTRQEIFAHLYQGTATSNQAVDLAIKSLRNALGSEFIVTDHGQGWRMAADIRHFEEVPPPPPPQEAISGADKPGIFEGLIDAARQSGASNQADRLCADLNRIAADHINRKELLRFVERYIQSELDDTEEWISSTSHSTEEEKKKPRETDGAIAASAFTGIFYARELSDAKKKKRTLEEMRSEISHLTGEQSTDDIVGSLSKIVRFNLGKD